MSGVSGRQGRGRVHERLGQPARGRQGRRPRRGHRDVLGMVVPELDLDRLDLDRLAFVETQLLEIERLELLDRIVGEGDDRRRRN